MRKFPIDMAGFGINLQLLLEKQNSYFTMLSKSYLEGAFVEEFVTQNELEGKADECTKVSLLINVYSNKKISLNYSLIGLCMAYAKLRKI